MYTCMFWGHTHLQRDNKTDGDEVVVKNNEGEDGEEE